MRLAVIADVHADVVALRDALTQAQRLGCKQVLCAGDIVGYGGFPEETVGLICGRHIPCVRGNHDRWAINPAMAGDLTTRLSNDALVYLGGLATVWKKVVEGVRLAMCHGNPTSDMEGLHPGTLISAEVRRLLQATESDVLICGHTHAAAMVADVGGGMIINPGALLREAPGHGPPPVRFDQRRRTFVEDTGAHRGTFGILDLPDKTFTLHLAADGRELPVPTARPGVVGQWR